MSADLDIDAAEYVLGTLDNDERIAFAGRLTSDADARAAVSAWETRFAGLSSNIPSVAPPPRVWAEIERAINRVVGAPSRFKVIDGGRPGHGASPALQRSLNRWRAAAVVSSGMAAALLVFIGVRETSLGTGESTTYVAAINRGGDKPALLVRVDMKTHSVYVRPVAAETPPGKSLELWYIADGKAPRSMGIVDKAPESLTIPQSVHAETATFAVSVEPPGGSKTGGPTGPVVYAGTLVKE